MNNRPATGPLITDVVSQALRTISSHHMRSLLLILGVAIGVMTLLAIFTIVTGLSGRIRDDIVSSSQPYIYVARFSGLSGGDPEKLMRRPQILPECAGALAETEGVDLVDYQISNGEGMVLKYEREKTNFVQAVGSSENFPFMFSLSVSEGRYFTAAEVAARSRVVVLGYGPRKDLFPGLDPIGKTLNIYGRPYLVVGTMTERKHIIGSMGDNYVVTPWTTYEKDCMHTGIEDRNIMAVIEDGFDTDDVISNITGTMRRERRLRPGQANDFDVVSSETFGDLIDKVTGGIALVLVVLSSVGLLVGGIGVMNIMLISVTERTREIGVRMALGARRRDVLLQVLLEAAVLTGIGGILGIGLGYLASWGMTHLLRFPFVISPWVTIGAALFSISIGIFFGLYPANKAARMDPITALGRL
ncbi:MAG: ABC transporter permease [Gemmatimonadales bacterium]|nr:ABC transporter permease [Gemmatimonadales bacterium]